jgi:hypothetical protein
MRMTLLTQWNLVSMFCYRFNPFFIPIEWFEVKKKGISIGFETPFNGSKASITF